MSPAKAKRFRPSIRTILTLAVLVTVGIALARFAQQRTAPPDPARATPVPLRAVPVDAHITGHAPLVCRKHTARDGHPLPDHGCTPGSRNTAVTQDTIDTTICRPGYVNTLLPPDAEVVAFRQKAMAAYDIPGNPADYELDPLV